ncbi:MAG: oxygen-dependent coproporphyrinogen oxidase [Alphaproteobacteria bacterium]|nr:oxygen-dependent coproporphyrinogen oxidase [Alphaproteobacteria bacterium]MBU1515721.1 oxygen-dependent coproporphyrinogen oxidase [Alphaproteobacteria bacterium]MBU2097004.1 oxygen-dependent coproporphyrinogen oxidase [Alphaproteobacteria bacterium]MBU2149520.1 oxygen-dependent coproporphyrinogen oxidase [Alphaproteobacteria bacterium]MBU2308906.1 oxygen-dependent coproporphyrinogen oxidase [Alphaproteobacteria bacterium]
MSSLPPEILARRDRAKDWFEALQTRICAELERLDAEAPPELYPEPAGQFQMKPWTRETGVGGGIGAFFKGRLFEKAAVHSSAALAKFSPEMAATMPGADKDPSYVSASISLIVHPRSPRVPTVHMNTRFLSTAESWFGGGADLTPMLDEQRSEEADDAKLFHAAMKGACDPFDPEWHPKYKAWCDEYFYLPHRKETRGVGGIFYDRHNTGDFEKDFAFTRAVGEAFLDVYPKIVRHRMSEPWGEAERQEQLIRRGRYVEFNLLYDRGTMFGLKAGGNIETILSSMPPMVAWS